MGLLRVWQPPFGTRRGWRHTCGQLSELWYDQTDLQTECVPVTCRVCSEHVTLIDGYLCQRCRSRMAPLLDQFCNATGTFDDFTVEEIESTDEGMEVRFSYDG